MFSALAKESLADRVYRQLCETILQGQLRSGDKLPAERILAEQLGVNRGAVREGLKRLQQADLIQVRHGGATEIRDWREHAGLELLPQLVTGPQGQINRAAVRGIMTLRTQLAPGVAASAARNARPEHVAALNALCEQLKTASTPAERQTHAHAFWGELVRASDNLGYQLAFNSLRRTYEQLWDLLTTVLDSEFRDHASLQGIVQALHTGNAEDAAAHARTHVHFGEQAITALLNTLPPAGETS